VGHFFATSNTKRTANLHISYYSIGVGQFMVGLFASMTNGRFKRVFRNHYNH